MGKYAKGRYKELDPVLYLSWHGDAVDAHHVDAQTAVAVDEVHGALRTVPEGGNVLKFAPPLLAVDPEEIVARAGGHIRHRHILSHAGGHPG